MKRPKTCIFCGLRGNLSKEHFWPEWLAPHLEPPESNAHVTEFHSAEGKQPHRLERRSERQGSVTTKKIRAVCASCNNGWMSSLESNAKPVLLALMNRNQSTISLEESHALARWVTLKSIVGEHSTEATALTPPDDRRAFYEQRAIPAFFRIFVGYHSLRTQTAYYRQSTTVSTSMRGPEPPLPPAIQRNIEATTFLVGPLCFYVTAARVTGLRSEVLDPIRPMQRIWPEPEAPMTQLSSAVLAQADIYLVSRSLDRLVADPRVKYGGPLPRQESAT